MQRSTDTLSSQNYDVVVIGGGITGAFIALDAATRGMSVALVEKKDFGAATSSASSKLLHGGIRYLQQGRLLKLRESAWERTYFQTLAPHLCHYVPFVVPSYPGFKKGKLLLGTGLAMYEALCIGQNKHIADPAKQVPRGRVLRKHEIREWVEDSYGQEMTGGILLYESHMRDSERMTLSVLRTAAAHGAKVENYVQAESFVIDHGRVIGINAVDRLTNTEVEVRGSLVVNAAGPWIPSNVNKLGALATPRVVTAFARGAHIVTKPLTDGFAIALPIREQNQALLNRGGRHVFIIPWHNHSLIGTSYNAYKGDPDNVQANESDVEELMGIINAAFGKEVLTRGDVVHAYAGLYPLTEEHINPKVYQGTADYQVVDHAEADDLEGLVSVFGAKYTTARRLGEQAVDTLVEKLGGAFRRCQTQHMRLLGGDIENINEYRHEKKQQYESSLSPDLIDGLINRHGTKIDEVIALVEERPQLAERFIPECTVIEAEVIYAVRHEKARHLDDFIFRRTNIGLMGYLGEPVLQRCARLMAEEASWDGDQIEGEVRETRAQFLDRSVPDTA